MKLLAAPTTSTPEKAKRAIPSVVPVVILVLVLLAAGISGLAYLSAARGPSNYACMAVTNDNGDVSVTTSGLLHYVSNQYYVSCNEGSGLPTSQFKSSCLSITPQTVPARIGVGASTEYYYFSSSGGHTIELKGASPMSNGQEIIDMAGLSLVVDC